MLSQIEIVDSQKHLQFLIWLMPMVKYISHKRAKRRLVYNIFPIGITNSMFINCVIKPININIAASRFLLILRSF